MSKKKVVGGDVTGIDALKDIKGIMFRYIPLIILYTFSLIYIFNNSTQYILFICLLVLTIFGMIFILRDLFTINLFYNCFFNIAINEIEKCTETDSLFLKLSIFALIIGMLSQFIALCIVVAVFDYGKQGTNSFIVNKMSGANQHLLFMFKQMLIASSIIIITLSFFVGFAYGISLNNSINMQIMRNIGCITLSMLMLALTSYEIYLSVMFLKNKQHKVKLYVI